MMQKLAAWTPSAGLSMHDAVGGAVFWSNPDGKLEYHAWPCYWVVMCSTCPLMHGNHTGADIVGNSAPVIVAQVTVAAGSPAGR